MVAAFYKNNFIELNQERPAEANYGNSNVFCVATDELGRSWSDNCIRKIQTKMSAYVHKRSQRRRWRRKVSYFLLWSGEKGLDLYNSWTFTKEEDRKKPAIIFERFENQLEPKTSHRIDRYTLQGMRQE